MRAYNMAGATPLWPVATVEGAQTLYIYIKQTFYEFELCAGSDVHVHGWHGPLTACGKKSLWWPLKWDTTSSYPSDGGGEHLSMLMLLLLMIWMNLRHVHVSAGYWQPKVALTTHLNQSCVWSVYQTRYDLNDIHSKLYTEQGTEGGLMPCKQ